MNKIFNINLGGYPFTIDDDAYRHLTQYVDTIERHFRNSEGCEEIISDIEARMAELINEKIKGQSIVGKKEVEEVIKIMGTPEDFGAESIEEEPIVTQKSSRKSYKTGKRLFRNTEDQILGGVCSGVASYFGITDPLWIRLAFVLVTISGGVGILAYIILWVILPEAKTAGDKLLMRGEPINVSNIAKTVEKELEELSEKINEFGNEIKSKKKSIKGTSFILSPKNILAKGFSILGKGIKGIFKLLKLIFKPFFFLILGIIIFALGISWISLLFGIFSATPYASHFISGFAPVGYIGLINVFVVVGVPLMGLILLATRILTSYRIERSWLRTAWTVWGVNLISLGLIAMNTVNMNSSRSTYSQQLPVIFDKNEVVKVNVGEKPFDISFARFGDLMHHNGKLYSEDIHISFDKSPNDEFQLIKQVSSRGKNQETAQKWASKLVHEPVIVGNNITLPAYYQLKKGSKFRFQEVRYKLLVPTEGKIQLDDDARWYVGRMFKDSDYDSPWNVTEYEWEMGNNGMLASEYISELRYEKDLGKKDFDKLNIQGEVEVKILKGDKYEARLIGREKLVESAEIIQNGNMLSILTDHQAYKGKVKLEIKMPVLNSLHTTRTQDVHVEGFEQAEMEIQHRGNSSLKAFVNVDKMDLVLDENSSGELTGSGSDINLEVMNYSKFKGENYIVNNAKLKAKRYSLAALHVKELLEYEVDQDYRLKVYGDPEMKRTMNQIQ